MRFCQEFFPRKYYVPAATCSKTRLGLCYPSLWWRQRSQVFLDPTLPTFADTLLISAVHTPWNQQTMKPRQCCVDTSVMLSLGFEFLDGCPMACFVNIVLNSDVMGTSPLLVDFLS
eukprot:TRINITY_DN59416_c0_g1_i1.p1 TRINITY_DN59416_c0_g1~~TRINITY_DN59416_c0_g1_i1.p1  ORF type:complete len:116 (-),score=5.55 TRINITY_DN59416_c0_g1_i1:12-359(-)